MSSPAAASRQRLFMAFAVLFIGAALFHAVHVFVPEAGPASPPWRHALFVIINLVVAACLLSRPRVFVGAFAILTLQQMYGHGSMALDAWQTQRQVDWMSLGIVVLMPVIFVLLVLDARRTSD